MKRLISLFLVVAILFAFCVPVQAKWKTQSVSSGSYYRISYANNNRYLDIPSEGYNNNGTQLQLWDYAEGNQNQIFRLVDTGNGWHIISQNGRIVEVRDSRHDDCAPVAQWDYHNLNCGLWNIRCNDDGTVSFQNRESGKYLNVEGGGNAKNGNKIIQYHDDGTVAMRFYLEALGNEDVLGASYVRTLYRNEVSWGNINRSYSMYYADYSGWAYQDGNTYYFPSVGQKVFVSMEFLSPLTVENLVYGRSYNQSVWDQIKQAATGEASSEVVSAVGEKLGFTGGVGGFTFSMIVDICQILLAYKEQNNWNNFLRAAKPDWSKPAQGVIVYHYYQVTWASTSYPRKIYIRKEPVVEYKSWTGNNFGDVKGTPVSVRDGNWSYQFR